MAQGFQPSTPGTNALAVSQEVRDSLAALLSNNAGATAPGYLVEGSTYFGQGDGTAWAGGGHLHVAKTFGSLPYGVIPMGAVPLTVYVTPLQPGVDGATLTPTIRVATPTFLGSLMNGDVGMYFANTELRCWFSSALSPSYVAARKWNAAGMLDPAIVSPDGRLIGKVWETLPPLTDWVEYAPGSPAILLNGPSYTAGLRLVDAEKRQNRYEFFPALNQDHIIIPGNSGTMNVAYWWEVQEGLFSYELWEAGVRRNPDTYKVIPITADGASVSFVVYNLSTQQVNLAPFILNGWYEFRVNKGL